MISIHPSTLPHCPVPTITAEVVPPGNPLAAGQSYSLMCTVTGADSLNATINYKWLKGPTPAGTDSPTLTFDPLVLSDAAQYSCEVTVTSPFLADPLTDTSDAVDLNIQRKT